MTTARDGYTLAMPATTVFDWWSQEQGEGSRHSQAGGSPVIATDRVCWRSSINRKASLESEISCG